MPPVSQGACALEHLPRDLEVLAFEAGCKDYCKREVDGARVAELAPILVRYGGTACLLPAHSPGRSAIDTHESVVEWSDPEPTASSRVGDHDQGEFGAPSSGDAGLSPGWGRFLRMVCRPSSWLVDPCL
jgi:hypothetical protein